MKMDSRGFILFETMLSLLILGITFSVVLPALIHIQELRSNTQDQREALRLLEYEIRSGTDSEVESGVEDSYHFSEREITPGKREVCIHWKGVRERDQQLCLETYSN